MRAQRLTKRQREQLRAELAELLVTSMRLTEAVDSGDELVMIDQRELQSLTKLINPSRRRSSAGRH